MPYTALSVANDILDEIGLPRQTVLVSASTQQGRRMLASMHAAGRALAKFDWSRLQAVTTVSASGSSDFGLPAGFRGLVPNTIWNVTEGWQARGPVRMDESQELEGGLVTVGIYDTWKIQLVGHERKIRVIPTPATADLFSYSYYTKNWVVQTGSSTLSDFVSADGDYFLLDGDLVKLETHWRFLKNIGQPYAEEKEEAERARRIAMAHDGGMQEINAGFWSYDESFPAQSPETSVGL